MSDSSKQIQRDETLKEEEDVNILNLHESEEEENFLKLDVSEHLALNPNPKVIAQKY